MPEEIKAWVASFQNQHLRVSETEDGYLWNVTNPETGELVGQGEARSREDAFVSAAEAAHADWGGARWRCVGDDAHD